MGRKMILKCLLYIKSLFNNTEGYYLLNELYITDYCVWIQHVTESNLKSLYDQVQQVKPCKEDVGLGLPAVEQRFLEECDSETEDSGSDDSSSESEDMDSDDSSDSEESSSTNQADMTAVEQQFANLFCTDNKQFAAKASPLIQVLSSSPNAED